MRWSTVSHAPNTGKSREKPPCDGRELHALKTRVWAEHRIQGRQWEAEKRGVVVSIPVYHRSEGSERVI